MSDEVLKEVSSLEEDVMGSRLNEYFERDDQIKQLTKYQDEVKKIAREYVTSHGSPDSKGSIKMEIPEGKMQLIVRESVSLDQDKAVAFMESHSFTGAIKVSYSVDEDYLADLYKTGKISTDDLRSLVVKKSNTALYLRKPKAKDESSDYTVSKSGLASVFAALEI